MCSLGCLAQLIWVTSSWLLAETDRRISSASTSTWYNTTQPFHPSRSACTCSPSCRACPCCSPALQTTHSSCTLCARLVSYSPFDPLFNHLETLLQLLVMYTSPTTLLRVSYGYYLFHPSMVVTPLCSSQSPQTRTPKRVRNSSVKCFRICPYVPTFA